MTSPDHPAIPTQTERTDEHADREALEEWTNERLKTTACDGHIGCLRQAYAAGWQECNRRNEAKVRELERSAEALREIYAACVASKEEMARLLVDCGLGLCASTTKQRSEFDQAQERIAELTSELDEARGCGVVTDVSTDRSTGITDVDVCENSRPCSLHPADQIIGLVGLVADRDERIAELEAESQKRLAALNEMNESFRLVADRLTRFKAAIVRAVEDL